MTIDNVDIECRSAPLAVLPADRVAYRDRLPQQGDVDLLVKKEIDALIIHKFYDPDWAAAIGERLIADSKPYVNASLVRRASNQIAYYESVSDPIVRQQYLKGALQNLDDARQICSPHAHPIDLVRVILDERHSRGMRILQHRSGPMFAGLMRAFAPGGAADPHIDNLLWDDAGQLFPSLDDGNFQQLAGNVYMKMPAHGGELHIWTTEPDQAAHERRRDPASSYGLVVSDLGAPAIRIKPHAGDLVLFRSSCIHSVTKCSGWRVAASFFLIDCKYGRFIYS